MNASSHSDAVHHLKPMSVPMQLPLVQRKCACGGSSGISGSCADCDKKKLLGQPLQTKLRINEPGDQYEQEADRVAALVMGMTDSESQFNNLSASLSVQRRSVTDDSANVLQRAEGPGETAGPKDSGSAPEESRCPSWRNDPQSISKRAAETYVQNDMNPPSQATVEKINCEPPIANGNYGCYVHFSDGLVIRVIVRATDIIVGTGPGPFTTLTPPPGTPLCFYDYHCPDGLLVLTKRECKSAKPPSSSGPTLVGQRRAAPGAAGAMDASSAVRQVLVNPGQPLDGATQEFFSARLGHDFANVRVHADAEAAQSARAVNALAYTVGRDVVFDAGQYAPATRAGQELLAHELTHVVQQRGDVSMNAPARIQRTPAESSATCTEMAFYTFLDMPRPMKNRFFSDGEEIDRATHDAAIGEEAAKGKCNINLTQEVGLNLGPLNPSVTVNFFYRGEPCCRCFKGALGWDVEVTGIPQPHQIGSQAVGTGDDCVEKCCSISKSLPISLDISLGKTFHVSGTIQLEGATYRPE